MDPTKATPPMRSFYARDAASAETMRERLIEAGLQVEPVAQVDLFDEGLSLVPRKAFRVSVVATDGSRAAEVLAETAAGVIEWVEDLSHLSPLTPFPPRPREDAHEDASLTLPERRQAWEGDPATWSNDLFSENEEVSASVVQWLVSSPVPTAHQIGKALERAIREGREDLIWPICRVLKPVVVDYLQRGGLLRGDPLMQMTHEAFSQRSPGTKEMLDDLVELAWDAAPATRKRFCLAAGQLGSETFLPVLVSLLDDPEEEVRYEASGALYGMVHQDFGYDSEAPAEVRSIAVALWKEWLTARYGGTSWSS